MADAWGIIDFIKSSNVKFNTICRGNALSAAALILLAGTGSRVASKHATIMLHQPMMYLERSDYTRISNVMRNAEYSRIQLDQFYTFLGASTNKDKVWWETMLRDDMWLTATDAQQLNIIDSII
jgi:ATP-dependent protease ClpP protease subunit